MSWPAVNKESQVPERGRSPNPDVEEVGVSSTAATHPDTPSSATPAPKSDTDSVLVVLGRLLACPRGRTHDARARLELLAQMLRQGGGWWRAEDLAAPDGSDLGELRARLRELRRIGVLEWDERAQAFALREQLRVPLALCLLATQLQPDSDQLAQLDALIPFAQLAGRSVSEQEAPIWAMLDLLERDVRAMERALEAGQEALEQVAQERWLPQHAADMQRTVDRLAELELERPSASRRKLIDRGMELLNQAGEYLGRLSVRMSRTSRDQVRLPGARRSAAELRAACQKLALEDLAECVTEVGLPAQARAIPSEEALADAFPRELLDSQLVPARRSYPNPDQLSLTDPPPPGPPEPDPREMASRQLAGQPPKRLARHLFAPVGSWEEAIRLHQGLLRVQAEAARLGKPGWRSLPEPVELEESPVAWLFEIERVEEETAAA